MLRTKEDVSATPAKFKLVNPTSSISNNISPQQNQQQSTLVNRTSIIRRKSFVIPSSKSNLKSKTSHSNLPVLNSSSSISSHSNLSTTTNVTSTNNSSPIRPHDLFTPSPIPNTSQTVTQEQAAFSSIDVGNSINLNAITYLKTSPNTMLGLFSSCTSSSITSTTSTTIISNYNKVNSTTTTNSQHKIPSKTTNGKQKTFISFLRSVPQCYFCSKYRTTIEQDNLDKHISERKIRKLLDIDITNQSLVAINETLEMALVEKELELRLLKREMSLKSSTVRPVDKDSVSDEVIDDGGDDDNCSDSECFQPSNEEFEATKSLLNNNEDVIGIDKCCSNQHDVIPVDDQNTSQLKSNDLENSRNKNENSNHNYYLDIGSQINVKLEDPERMFHRISQRLLFLIQLGKDALKS